MGWGCGRVFGNRQYSSGSSNAAGTIQIKVRKCCESINDAIDFFLPNSWLEFFNKTMEFFLRDHVIICPLLCRAPQFLKKHIFNSCKLYSVKPYNKISINNHSVCTEKIIRLKLVFLTSQWSLIVCGNVAVLANRDLANNKYISNWQPRNVFTPQSRSKDIRVWENPFKTCKVHIFWTGIFQKNKQRKFF